MGAGEIIVLILFLGAVAVAGFFIWRSKQWEKAAQQQRRRADEAQEDELRREDVKRQLDKTDDELLEDFLDNFGGGE